jgi:hypothetical protein
MRRIALGFALGVLLAAAPGGAALAAQPEATILTPEQVGLSNPGQGYYPFFVGAGSNPFQQPGSGFFGSGSLTGIGVTSLATSGAPRVGQPGFSGFSGLPSAFSPGGIGAGSVGGFGLGGTFGGVGFGGTPNPFTLGAASLTGTGCGVFSLNFCPLFSSAPLSQGLTPQFGLGATPFGLTTPGLGTLGLPGLSGLGGQVLIIQ